MKKLTALVIVIGLMFSTINGFSQDKEKSDRLILSPIVTSNKLIAGHNPISFFIKYNNVFIKKSSLKEFYSFKIEGININDSDFSVEDTDDGAKVEFPLPYKLSSLGKKTLYIKDKNSDKTYYATLPIGGDKFYINPDPTPATLLILPYKYQDLKITGKGFFLLTDIKPADESAIELDNFQVPEKDDELIIRIKIKSKPKDGKIDLKFFGYFFDNNAGQNEIAGFCNSCAYSHTFDNQLLKSSRSVSSIPETLEYLNIAQSKIMITFPTWVEHCDYTIESSDLEILESEISPTLTQHQFQINLVKPLKSNPSVSTKYKVIFKSTSKDNIAYNLLLDINPKPTVNKFTTYPNNDYKIDPFEADNYYFLVFDGVNLDETTFRIAEDPDNSRFNLARSYQSALKQIWAISCKKRPDGKPVASYNLPYHLVTFTKNMPIDTLSIPITVINVNRIADISPIFSLPKAVPSNKVGSTSLSDKKEDLVLLIDEQKLLPKEIPQFINVTAYLFDENDNILKTVPIDFDGKRNLKIGKFKEDGGPNTKLIPLSTQMIFRPNDLIPGRQVKIEISHASDAYPNNIENIQTVSLSTNIRGTFFDNWGISLSVPPALGAVIWPHSYDTTKTIINGETIIDVKTKHIVKFQPLILNAGVGIKYQPRNNWHNPSKFSIGAYVMKLNIGSTNQDVNGTIEYIGKSSLAFLALAQINLTNLETKLETPVFAGIGYCPSIDGHKFFLSAGVSIDLTFVKGLTSGQKL